MNEIFDIIIDIFVDSAKMLPLIILTYALLDLYEKNTNINAKINLILKHKWGPLFGALIGCIPQCGFSFMGATLFVNKMLSPGTMVAIFIATSDEALPLLIANPSAYQTLIVLIIIKIVIAVIGGYLFDFIWFRLIQRKSIKDEADDDLELVINDPSCVCENSLFYNVSIRSLRTIFLVFMINALLSFTIYFIGEANLISFLDSTLFIQPLLAAIIGFIPNCAASIVLTQLYLLNGISFGALVSGLCMGAGLGSVVLIKEYKDKRKLFIILAYLFSISIISGELIHLLSCI